LGKEWADKLSPIGRIYEKTNPTGKFGMPTKEYVIEGISSLDYYVIYQKFNLEKQESYKLDNIGQVELGINKIQHEGNLWELSKNDWHTYTDYNIRDVEILVKLEEKKGYISLLRFLAYTGLCDLENAIKTVPPMNGAIAIRARMRGEYIPTFIRPVTDYKAPGGYVAEPRIGFAEDIVSFDANSLYPSVMISLNLSPETKIGRVEKIKDVIKIHHASGRIFEMSPQNFKKYITEEKASLTKAGFLFSQKKVGLVPEFLDNLYTKRKEMKSKMLDCRKKGDKEGEQKFDTIQYAYKIHLNSLYGYMLNKYAPMGDEDIGTSVTLTGQAVIKKSNELFLEYARKELGDDVDTSSLVLYNDTDSVVGDTMISTRDGYVKIEDLWGRYSKTNEPEFTHHEHEVIKDLNFDISTYDPDTKTQFMGKCDKIFRHKVTKRKFKIKYGDKHVIITEDHGLMIYREGVFMRVSPLECRKGDKIIIETP
jgi:DNA polymerase elongation subunit (family B)